MVLDGSLIVWDGIEICKGGNVTESGIFRNRTKLAIIKINKNA